MNITEKLKKVASKKVASIAASAVLLGGAMGCDSKTSENDLQDTKPTASEVQKKAKESVGEKRVKLLGKENYYRPDAFGGSIKEILYFDSDGNDDTVEGIAWVRRSLYHNSKYFIADFELKTGTIKTEKEWNEFLKKIHTEEGHPKIEWVYPKGRGQENSKIPTQVLKDVKAQQK